MPTGFTAACGIGQAWAVVAFFASWRLGEKSRQAPKTENAIATDGSAVSTTYTK